jgi:hypothetical protein
MSRAARYDGWLPNYLPTGKDAAAGVAEFTPEHLREGVEWIRTHRAAAGLVMDGYDIIVEGSTPADDPTAAAAKVTPWIAAGATWWLDADWSGGEPAAVRAASERRLRAGPPR